jgi:two-component system phosphate regulon sensor histidine kinase PhoR
VGIGPKEQKQVFERFYRVPQGNLHEVKGFGLGLSYVKDVVERHGGMVVLKSSLGEGSTFTLHFPFKNR